MWFTRLVRARRSRTQSLVAILLVTVGLAAFLAFEAWDAARSHRATAEGALRDYAKLAAWEFSVSAKDKVYSTLSWAFSPIASLEVGPKGTPLPDPSVLGTEKFAKLLCSSDSSRYHFMVDLRDGSLVTSGEAPSSAMRRWLLDTIPKNAKRRYTAEQSYAVISGHVDGRPRTLAYHLRRDAYDRPGAAYGFELCLTQFAWSALQYVMESVQILPPSLTGGVPNKHATNDSLFSVQVRDGGGIEIFRSKVEYPATYSGENTLDAFGGLTSVVSLNPQLAKVLIIGGLPSERLPLLLGVLALTIALAAMGVMQLRREQELSRLRADFIASVSHELRTPLAQVRMFAETLLLGRVRSDEERDRSLQIVDQEARRLTHLVENILQFSRAERQAIRLVPVPTNLGEQVLEALEVFTPIARARRVTVEAALDEHVVAAVDPGAFRQILLNLLDNAVKYGPAGQTVTVSLRRVGGRVLLMVDDEGPGIAPRDRSRIWSAYTRLEGAVSSAVAGSGIGLSVVAELVALHGGRAWVEDAPSRGARFAAELPGRAMRDGGGETREGRREALDGRRETREDEAMAGGATPGVTGTAPNLESRIPHHDTP